MKFPTPALAPLAPLALSLLVSACGSSPPPPAPSVSSTIALSSDDKALWVVNPDADSVTLVDPVSRSRIAEVLLAASHPTVDATTMRYEPTIKPRALAILPGDKKIYVAGQTANRVYVIDAAAHTVDTSIAVGASPVGIVASQDGSAVYVVNHESASISKIDPRTNTVVATLPVGEHPWGASLSGDGANLYVSQFLLHPGVTTIATSSFTVTRFLELAEQMPDDANGKLVPNGLPRGVYQAVPRPVTGEVWMAHMLLAVKTPEPDLDFESTTFPTISTTDATAAAEGRRLLFKPLTVPGATGSFNDVISGPRALAFTPDGNLALLTNAGSEDVMVFDAAGGTESGLVRPLGASFPEGIVVDHAGAHAYVNGRNSHNVVALAIAPTDPIAPVTVDGAPIELLETDPMPDTLRLGQRLFYSANSAAFPVTQNFWVSCSTCHLEGGTDAVTWLFTVGPRDTPSNAGGPINTGFLLRQALRNSVVDYDTTINLEQGGQFHRTQMSQVPMLDALASFVNQAIPFPQNPFLENAADDSSSTHAQAALRGKTTFSTLCASCHTGPYYTDSGAGNPTLDLTGTILLHDAGKSGLGTCVETGAFVDQPAPDEVVGMMHTACNFDTPTLRSIFATPPYFHDGSAATLTDVVNRLPPSATLSAQDKADLVAFLETL